MTAHALVRAELSKTLTTRTLWAFLAGGVAFAALNAVIIGAASGTLDSVTEKQEALSGLPVLLLAWGLVGAAGEYRHRTAAPAALVARHGRGTLLAARMTAYAVAGLAIGVVVSAAAVAVALPLLAGQPGPALTSAQVGEVVGANLVAGVLSAVIGVAVGAMVRNQVVGVVAVLVVNFAVLPLLSGASETLGNLTPFGASSVLSGMTHDTTLTTAAAGLVLAAWTAGVAAAALAGERRRDLA
jgi:ABC-2 type transport system permease protein